MAKRKMDSGSVRDSIMVILFQNAERLPILELGRESGMAVSSLGRGITVQLEPYGMIGTKNADHQGQAQSF